MRFTLYLMTYILILWSFFLLFSITGQAHERQSYVHRANSFCEHHSCGRYIGLVDFSLSDKVNRFFIVDNKLHKVVYSTLVAHGKGSGGGDWAYRFSNKNGSHESALGAYKVGGTYYGKHGVSKILIGLDATNNQAYNRTIVLHSAPYVAFGGHSYGCFAVTPQSKFIIFNCLQAGSYLIAFK